MRKTIAIAAALLAAAPAAAQQDITAPGTVAHRAADTGFPESVGDFRRVSVYRYDAEGRDLSATYNLVRDGRRLVLTAYIYPAPPVEAASGGPAAARALSCRAEFSGVHEAIMRQHDRASLREEGQAPAMAGVRPELSLRSVHAFRMRFDDEVQEIRSETDLYCYVGSAWLVKYRVSGPAGLEVGDAIAVFIRAGPWPGRRPAEEVAALLPRGR